MIYMIRANVQPIVKYVSVIDQKILVCKKCVGIFDYINDIFINIDNIENIINDKPILDK